jgi:hypothetical protein
MLAKKSRPPYLFYEWNVNLLYCIVK